MAKHRDYKAEYRRRVERGMAKGLSRRRARGHPGAAEVGVPESGAPPKVDKRLEQALHEMRQGSSLSAAARSQHVTTERLRNYLLRMDVVAKRGSSWVPGPDTRSRQVEIFSKGDLYVLIVPNFQEAERVGRYMAAVGQFLRTNDPAHLEPFQGQYVVDIKGKKYVFETDPRRLYPLSVGAESFEDVYRIIR